MTHWSIPTTLTILILAAAGAQAQDIGRPERGRTLALQRCTGCHAVERGQARSPRSGAAPFAAIAATAGMTETALRASLQTSHRTMPNLIVEGDDQRDIIAYILSLGTRD